MHYLDKIEKLRSVCGNSWVTLMQKDDSVINVARLRMRCNSWLCDYCREKKAKKFSAALLHYFKDEKISLLTLTDGHDGSLLDSYKNISRNWNLFRTKLTKKFGAVKFVKVLEAQSKSGYAHLHVIINKYIPARWLNENVSASGFGRIYDVKKISGKCAFFYVQKYLSKPWSHAGALQCCVDLNLRLCSGSRGFKLSDKSVSRWKLIDFKCTDDRSHDYVDAIKRAYSQNSWEMVECTKYENWESARLEWPVEKLHQPPDIYLTEIDDDFHRIYYCPDLDAGF